jgi:hypothetical protein
VEEVHVWGDFMKEHRNAQEITVMPNQEINANNAWQVEAEWEIILEGAVIAAVTPEEARSARSGLQVKRAVADHSEDPGIMRLLGEQHDAELAKAMTEAIQGQIPTEWLTPNMAGFRKPGKPAGPAKNFRDVIKMHIMGKLMTRVIYNRIGPTLNRRMMQCMFGGVPKKRATYAIAISDEMQQRARLAGVSFATLLSDIKQAFYKINRDKMYMRLQQQLQDQAAVLQVVRRHRGAIMRIVASDGTILELALPTGTWVGDPLGMLLFNVYFQAYLEDLKATREQRQRRPLTAVLAGELEMDATDVVFADDQATHFEVSEWQCVIDEHNLQEEVRGRWDLESEASKCEVMVCWRGKGSKEKQQFPPAYLEVRNGRLTVSQTARHLGMMRGSATSYDRAVQFRSEKACRMRDGLRRTVFRPSGKREVKLSVYKTVVKETLLYGMDILPLGRAQISKLEKVQMSCIRAIMKPRYGQDGPTSNALRAQAKIPTIESTLRVRRLTWWKAVLKGGSDTAMVRAVLLGEVQGWAQQANKSRRLATLAMDIAYLQDVMGIRALEESGHG